MLVVLEESRKDGRGEREREEIKFKAVEVGRASSEMIYWFCGCDGLTFTDFIASLVMEAILARDTGGLESQMEFSCVRKKQRSPSPTRH